MRTTFLIVVSFCLAALCGALGTGSALGQVPAEKRVALVVGNAAYRSVPVLANSTADAQLVAKTLKELGFTIIGGGAQLNLDHAGFARAVQQFGDAIPGSAVALFYYAGHGLQMQGENYLVPVDANPTKPSDADFQLVAATALLHVMQDSGARLNIVIFDACRNNPFGGRGLRDVASGLAQMQAPKGTLISYATQPGNVAQDGPPGGNGPFASALTQVMRVPGLDVLQTFNRVGVAVAQKTRDEQEPWQSSSPVEGSFYFVPGESEEMKRARLDAAQAKADADAAKARADAAQAQAQTEAAELAKAKAEIEQAKADAAAARAQIAANSSKSQSDSDDQKKQAAAALAQAQAEAAHAEADARDARAQAEATKVQAEAARTQAQAELEKARDSANGQQVALATQAPAPPSGAQQPTAPAAAAGASRRLYAKSPPPGACPATGTKMLFTTGDEITITGADGLWCAGVGSQRGAFKRYALLLSKDVTSLADNQKADLSADAMAAVAQLWPLEVGKSVHWIRRDNAQSDMYIAYTVDRKETIKIPAGEFDTFVVIREDVGSSVSSSPGGYHDTQSFYISTDLGYTVKYNYHVISGLWRNPPKPWELVSITPPAQ